MDVALKTVLPQHEADEKKRDFAWVNFIRVISVFLIVMAHTGSGGGAKWTQTFYYTITRMGVPFFFMSTGYLLLSHRETLIVFFRKQLLPLLFSFFIWSTLYDLMHYETTGWQIPGPLSVRDPINLVLRILYSARVGYFWFFYALIALCLFTPVLWVILAQPARDEIKYYIGLSVATFAFIPMFRTAIGVDFGFEPPFVQRYLGYFLLGYSLALVAKTRKSAAVAAGIFLASFSFTFAVFHFNLPPLDNDDFFRSYMSFNIVAMSSSCFLLLKWIGERLPSKSFGMLETLDQASLGIYVSHYIMLGRLSLLFNKVNYHPPTDTAWIVPVIASIAFLASFVITMIIRKIPILKHTTPHLGR